ncbi:MAG: hypothetical protein R3D67_07055 [Hyphomicrobiaceae bacterium]
MREETRKRLDRALLARKLKWAGLTVAAVLATGVAIYVKNIDDVVETRAVDGVVVFVGPLVGKYRAVVARNNLEVDVKLDDTHTARLLAPKGSAPKVGDHIKVADQIHGTGRHTYRWK